MEIVILGLSIIVIVLSYKVFLLKKHTTVISFYEKNLLKLLIKKGFINLSEFDVTINESIGDMDERVGNQIIKSAKSIGIVIPKYMSDEDLAEYIKNQERKRAQANMSFTDSHLLDDV